MDLNPGASCCEVEACLLKLISNRLLFFPFLKYFFTFRYVAVNDYKMACKMQKNIIMNSLIQLFDRSELFILQDSIVLRVILFFLCVACSQHEMF